ncbi:hypothetical protein [Bdellovibrio sp. HCB274]|uniref:hypothetical protein n=1 Tax=Bdellovibrio sp. HCB274 TaxID=3394361 RepID=UPI0039B453AD
MKTKILIIVAAIIAATITYFNWMIPEDIACIESGGCYDHSAKTCRKTEPNAQELCNRSIDP